MADGIVRGGISGSEVNFEEGKTRSMVDQWRNKGDAEFRRHFEGKPQWVLEIEQSQEAGVYENQPTTREGVLREQDIYQPVGFSVPTEITKGMKDMWLNREAYEEEMRMRTREQKPEVRPKKKLFDAWIPEPGSEEEEEEEETPAKNDMVNGDVKESDKKSSAKKKTETDKKKGSETDKKKASEPAKKGSDKKKSSSDADKKKAATSDSKDKASPKKKATSSTSSEPSEKEKTKTT